VISSAKFRITEYEALGLGASQELVAIYRSHPMCLRDSSRFAAALSYARGAYVEVASNAIQESYKEWWYAGSLWKQSMIPSIRLGPKPPSD
jgi:hypothetical protein